MKIQRIQADIKTAKNNISPQINNTNDEYLYDIAAYHTQQAIEKELKYLLHDIYGEDNTTKKFKTHNISSLLLMLNNYEPDFIKNHPDIVNISDELTNWEASTRYGENLVATRDSINNALTYADALLKEIQSREKECTKQKSIISNEGIKKKSEPTSSDTINVMSAEDAKALSKRMQKGVINVFTEDETSDVEESREDENPDR